MTAVELHYTVDGLPSAPVFVLGPSLGTTTELWRGQIPGLTEQLRVIRYDHRGHGGSPVPPGPYALADLGGDVLALLDRLGLERVHLGGMSLGGMVSMWVAANAPDRVDRLVLMCTSARLGPPDMWAERAAIARAQGVEALADAAWPGGCPTASPAAGPMWSRSCGLCSPPHRPRATPDVVRRSNTWTWSQTCLGSRRRHWSSPGWPIPPRRRLMRERIAAGIPNARLELIGEQRTWPTSPGRN